MPISRPRTATGRSTRERCSVGVTAAVLCSGTEPSRGNTADSADHRRFHRTVATTKTPRHKGITHKDIAVEPQRHGGTEKHRDIANRLIAHRIFWTRIARIARIFRIGLYPVMQRQPAGQPRLGRLRPRATPCQEVVASRSWKVGRQTHTLVDRPSNSSGRAYGTPSRPRWIQDSRYPHLSLQGKKEFNARVGRVKNPPLQLPQPFAGAGFTPAHSGLDQGDPPMSPRANETPAPRSSLSKKKRVCKFALAKAEPLCWKHSEPGRRVAGTNTRVRIGHPLSRWWRSETVADSAACLACSALRPLRLRGSALRCLRARCLRVFASSWLRRLRWCDGFICVYLRYLRFLLCDGCDDSNQLR